MALPRHEAREPFVIRYAWREESDRGNKFARAFKDSAGGLDRTRVDRREYWERRILGGILQSLIIFEFLNWGVLKC